MEAVTIVELSVEENLPRQKKCCFHINLKNGLRIWLVVEVIIWKILLIIGLKAEIIFITATDLFDFTDDVEDSYLICFLGDRFYYVDQDVRSK